MIHTYVLHQFDGAWGLPSCSPFSLKMQTYLRMTGVPYRTASGFVWTSKTGKLPCLEDEQGAPIYDTEAIIAWLRRRFGDPLDASLTAEQRALGHLVRRMVEEHLYFVNLYFRWAVEENREIMYSAFVGKMTPEEMEKDREHTKRTFLQKIAALGIGGHDAATIAAKGDADVEALAIVLGDKPYFLGERATSVDASVYGLLANVLVPPIETPLKARVQATPSLVAYVERMRATYF